MKNLSLKTKRIIILLTPLSYILFWAIALLIELLAPSSHVADLFVVAILFLGVFVSFGAYYYFFFHYWRCPHCDKHLCHPLAILFVGWFWLLVTSPKECEHCAKPIDYSKAKPKQEKIPEWAQKFEKKDNNDENGYYRH